MKIAIYSNPDTGVRLSRMGIVDRVVHEDHLEKLSGIRCTDPVMIFQFDGTLFPRERLLRLFLGCHVTVWEVSNVSIF